MDSIHCISTNVLLTSFLTPALLVSGIQGSTRYLVIVLEVCLVLKSIFLMLEGTLASRLNFTYFCLLFCSKQGEILFGIFLSQPAPKTVSTAVEEEESHLPQEKTYVLLASEWF